MFKSKISVIAVGVALATPALSYATEESVFIEEVVVTAHPLSGEGVAQASDVLEGEELAEKLGTNLGDTLSREPGIHSASFGNAVGRPVIHGLGGPRVRTMEDRIDTMDVSVTSTDHAVTVDPFIAERVEVLKGSSTLLYGSGAIGGVVDVHTGRIPHVVPEQAISGGIETRYDDNTEGNSTAMKLNGGFGNFAWHVDGSWRDGDDYEIPGFAESKRLRASEEHDEDHDEDHEEDHEGEHHEGEEEARGFLPGSEFDFDSHAFGASYVGDWGFAGLSVSRLEGNYGLPGGHAHGHHEEGHDEDHDEEDHDEDHDEHGEEGGFETPIIEMEQTRVDAELGVKNPFGIFTSLNVRVGVNNYEHAEIEPDGEVATLFDNEAWEVRTELVYETGPWNGVIGFQKSAREFSAVGEEAFVPPVDTDTTGAFWAFERNFDSFDVESGLRMGRVEHDPEAGNSESFTEFAASFGIIKPLNDIARVAVLLDISSRAPVGEELYSNGPHLATNTFEIGNPDLDNERATGLSATLNLNGERWNGQANLYYTRFTDFIFEAATGEEEDELPVYVYQQNDATFRGIDAELSRNLANWDQGSLDLRGMLDYVSAEVDGTDNDNLPRIPPLRYGLGLTWKHQRFTASIDYIHASEQDDVADNEFVTDSYDDLRVHLGMDIPVGDSVVGIFLNGKNLTDDEQRLHTSFIKDYAPSPGRTIEAGVRVNF